MFVYLIKNICTKEGIYVPMDRRKSSPSIAALCALEKTFKTTKKAI